ncbi:MAG: hypothetical protein HY903_23780 [Deltaproteobacteria bacterium]|nr:hypothetical protein [Deltaproteobacteria bacterium]
MTTTPTRRMIAATLFASLAPLQAQAALPRNPIGAGSLVEEDENSDDTLLFAYTSRGPSDAPTLETAGAWLQSRFDSGVILELGAYPAHRNAALTVADFGFGGHAGMGFGTRVVSFEVTSEPALSLALGLHLQAFADYLRIGGAGEGAGALSAGGIFGLAIELYGRSFKEVDFRTQFSVDGVAPNYLLMKVPLGQERKRDDWLVRVGVHAYFNWSKANPTPLVISVSATQDPRNRDLGFIDRSIALGVGF